eukprot:jgi/Botrbrau1/2555/Bobra.0079s0042.1
MEEDIFDVLEPLPDIFALYMLYNDLYFENSLGACSVHWSSSRMTLCAGVCEFSKGGGCRIKLSEPLLKFRPTRDLKETLLHEMVHAWIFLQGIRDGDHGPRFQERVRFINAATFPDPQRPPGGYRVSTYHNFIAEVDHFRTHHWKCQQCDNLVKRAMNRPPQAADCRGRSGVGDACRDVQCAFHMHLRFCGGTYIKVAEPEGYGKKGKKAAVPAVPAERRNKPLPGTATHCITDFFHRFEDARTGISSSPDHSRLPSAGTPAAEASSDWPVPSGGSARDPPVAASKVPSNWPVPLGAAAKKVSGPTGKVPRDRPIPSWAGTQGPSSQAAKASGAPAHKKERPSVPSSNLPGMDSEARGWAKYLGTPGAGSAGLHTSAEPDRHGDGPPDRKRPRQDPGGSDCLHSSSHGQAREQEGPERKKPREGPGAHPRGERDPDREAMRRKMAEAAMRRIGVSWETQSSGGGAAEGYPTPRGGGEAVPALCKGPTVPTGSRGVRDSSGVSASDGFSCSMEVARVIRAPVGGGRVREEREAQDSAEPVGDPGGFLWEGKAHGGPQKRQEGEQGLVGNSLSRLNEGQAACVEEQLRGTEGSGKRGVRILGTSQNLPRRPQGAEVQVRAPGALTGAWGGGKPPKAAALGESRGGPRLTSSARSGRGQGAGAFDVKQSRVAGNASGLAGVGPSWRGLGKQDAVGVPAGLPDQAPGRSEKPADVIDLLSSDDDL